METVWIVLTQLVLLRTVTVLSGVESATVSAGDDKPGRLGDGHNVSITCTYTLDTDESADTMTIQRRKVTERSFSNIASFNIPAGTSSIADTYLVDRADLILLEGSVMIQLNNILCDDAGTYKCIFLYFKNQILYPIESSMVLTIEDTSKMDQVCTCVASLVGAAIGSSVLVALLGVGIIVCLIRQGRLQWMKSPEHKKPVHGSPQDSPQPSSVDIRPDVSENVHVYNNDYAVFGL